MDDRENERGSNKQQKVQFDSNRNQTHLLDHDAISASSSSHTSDSSLESTLTDKDDGDVLPELHQPSFDKDATGRPAGYDPNRIPSAVFNNRSTSPMEWSVASNESLFSIHMGNSSFSRDQAFLLYRSGELLKLDEVFSVPNALPPVSEGSAYLMEPETPTMTSSGISPSNFSAGPGPAPQNSPISEHKAGPSEASSKNTKPTTPESPKVEEDKGKALPMSPNRIEDARISSSMSTHSGGSGTSTSSFAFPIFGGGDMKNSLTKVEAPKEQPSPKLQEPKPQPPAEERQKPSRAGIGNWFSCFSCCLFRCSLSLK